MNKDYIRTCMSDKLFANQRQWKQWKHMKTEWKHSALILLWLIAPLNDPTSTSFVSPDAAVLRLWPAVTHTPVGGLGLEAKFPVFCWWIPAVFAEILWWKSPFSVENLANLVRSDPRFCWNFDHLCLAESQYFKSVKSFTPLKLEMAHQT